MTAVVALNGPATPAERVVLARRDIPLWREMATRGVTVRVVLLGDAGGLAEQVRESGLTVDVLPTAMAPRPSSVVRLPAAAAGARRLLTAMSPDLVEATEPLPAVVAGLAARGQWPVAYRRQHQRGRRPLLVASWLAARLSRCTIVSNEAMRQQAVRDDRTPLNRVQVASTGSPAPRAVSAAEVASLRAGLGVAPDLPLVVAVSWLRHEKGLDVLVDAAARLSGTRPLHLVLVGSGPERAALEARARDRGLAAHFPGHVDDVAPWYAAADVVVMPSRRESFGRTTLEAMAAGRPIVAARVGGIPLALADGTAGLLVPPDDPVALAAAIGRLLDDRVQAEALGRVARETWISRFTIGHMAEARVRAWRAVVNGEPATP